MYHSTHKDLFPVFAKSFRVNTVVKETPKVQLWENNQCYVAGSEVGGWGCEPRNVDDLHEVEKNRNGFSPGTSIKEHSPLNTLPLAWREMHYSTV